MKKIIISCIVCTVILYSCDTRTYEDISGPPVANITYTNSIKPIMNANCTSCHSPNGGQSPYLDNYDDVKSNINLILEDLNSGSMPPNGPLSSTTIQTVQSWKDAGTPQ
ncbi:hypothetical protein IV494_04765 [Kaistella sp. G5-32]|uniref:Cytochrome c domain-containing protein n=1 Tax=Kaistella gelatinilytica TaxID=2787636 RepID=A0ABS0F9W5_9FLAO|nr:hypothetical protein [Kaistella gelatinilytica]MBF8456487.1 hypothetical protein [Kaistella gelatinilytica]